MSENQTETPDADTLNDARARRLADREAAAVNVGCWAHRCAGIRFKADLSYEVFTHKGVTL